MAYIGKSPAEAGQITSEKEIIATAGQVAFVLDTTVSRETDIIVSINGVVQPASAYTIGGSYNKTLTMDAPGLALNDVLRGHHIGYQPSYFGLQPGSVDSAHLAAGSIDIAHLSATGTPSGDVALKGDNTWGTAAAPEIYGFSVDANGHLIVTTTNEGTDNITSATYATFKDALLSVSGYTWSLVGTQLRCTI